MHCIALHSAEAQLYTKPEIHATFHSHFQSHPELYNFAALPATWLVDKHFKKYIDVPMHLLFLGITKTVILDIQEWMKKKNIHLSFCKSAVGILENIQVLKLPWCKLLPFSNARFGGWVSENYIGFCRIMPWFYSLLNTEIITHANVDPIGPNEIWNKSQKQTLVENAWKKYGGKCNGTEGTCSVTHRIRKY
jgi:hypothetical protein